MWLSCAQKYPNGPDCPWNLLLYVDEITLGNSQKTANMRRINNIYASFLEFGLMLRCEALWLTLGCVRTTVAEEIAGLLSGLWGKLLRDMFHGVDSLTTAGIPLMLEDEPRIWFFKLAVCIMDEAAGKEVLGHKSASGILPCDGCLNVLNTDPDEGEECGALLEHIRGDYYVDITCTDPSRFDRSTNDDVWRKFDTLAAAKRAGCGAGTFKDIQKALGMTYSEGCLLADVELRHTLKPTDVLRDPMHVTVSNGVMNVEIYCVLGAIERETRWDVYPMLLTLAKSKWRTQAKFSFVFDEYHAKSTKKDWMFKGGGIGALGRVPVRALLYQQVCDADGQSLSSV